MEIADEEANKVLGQGKRPILAPRFKIGKELLAALGERSASDSLHMALAAREPRLARILRRRVGMQGEKGEYPNKADEYTAIDFLSGTSCEHGFNFIKTNPDVCFF